MEVPTFCSLLHSHDCHLQETWPVFSCWKLNNNIEAVNMLRFQLHMVNLKGPFLLWNSILCFRNWRLILKAGAAAEPPDLGHLRFVKGFHTWCLKVLNTISFPLLTGFPPLAGNYLIWLIGLKCMYSLEHLRSRLEGMKKFSTDTAACNGFSPAVWCTCIC